MTHTRSGRFGVPLPDLSARRQNGSRHLLADGRLPECWILTQWITTARAADLPHVHAFTNGLDLDTQAVTAALTLSCHNGRTEGVNTKTMIKRQMYGRADFTLLRHRILLGLTSR